MGRQIRRVIPNWQHPEESNGRFRPLFDESYREAITKWIEEHQLWEAGKHPDQLDKTSSAKEYRYFAEWNGDAPDVKYYRPDWKPEEATWYQVYETVSEGTPVTPPFETREELVEYLVANGDFWDQKRRSEGHASMPCEPWTRQQAESFVFGGGWAPSLVVSDGRIMSGVEAMAELAANRDDAVKGS